VLVGGALAAATDELPLAYLIPSALALAALVAVAVLLLLLLRNRTLRLRVLGGLEVGQNTLLRFYVLHIMVLPLVATVPRQGSPRTFAPVWLVLAAAFALWGRYIRWRPAVRVAAGVFAAGAVASLVFSVSVRLASADLMENAALALAPRVPEGGVIAVCDVPRTVVDPAQSRAGWTSMRWMRSATLRPLMVLAT
jgi:hypothetical protein